jgi:hypothetical protein
MRTLGPQSHSQATRHNFPSRELQFGFSYQCRMKAPGNNRLGVLTNRELVTGCRQTFVIAICILLLSL